MGEVSEEVRVLEYGERVQENREWGSDRAPCGAPAVIRAMVGSDSWVGGHSFCSGGRSLARGLLREVFCGPWALTLERQGEGALGVSKKKPEGGRGGGARR